MDVDQIAKSKTKLTIKSAIIAGLLKDFIQISENILNYQIFGIIPRNYEGFS